MNLGFRIAYLINIFETDTVVLGGGIQNAGGMIMEPIKKMVRRFVLNKFAGSVRIVAGSLGEDAASLGAASLTVRELFLRA